jgi:hypothetical protein
MSKIFTLKINLGNDAMCSDEDIVYALKQAASDIHKCFDLFDCDGKPIHPNHYPVRDRNGNKVGYYEVTE